MTDLKTIFNNLVFVIVSYVAEQKGQDKALLQDSFEKLLEKPHKELISDLAETIKELEGLNHETRISLMNYLLEIINQLRPLAFQESTLTENSITLIQETLVGLIENLIELMNLSHNSIKPVEYNSKEFVLYGFTRTFWAQCYSSQLLTTYFLKPFNISFQTDKSHVAPIVEGFLKGHKQASRKEEEASLTAQLEALLTKVEEKELEIGHLSKTITALQQTIAAQEQKIVALQQTITAQEQKIVAQDQALTTKQTTITAQQKRIIAQQQKITGLEKEKSPAQNSPYPSFFTALRQMYPNAALPDSNLGEPRI